MSRRFASQMVSWAELEHEIVAGGGISPVWPSFFLFHDRCE